MRRAGRGGVVRGVAKTAVVAGTASAVAGRVHHRQEAKWGAQEAQQQAAVDQQQAAIDQQQQIADLQAQQNALAQQQAQQQYAPPPQQYAPPPQQYAPPPQQYAPPPQQYYAPETQQLEQPSGNESPMVQQLQQLAEFHESGILSDEEFATAKQRILAGG